MVITRSPATTGSNSALAYLVAFASTSSAAAPSTRAPGSSRGPAATAAQAADARRNRDMASKVANAPRYWVEPTVANSAAAKKAAGRPASRVVIAHRRDV